MCAAYHPRRINAASKSVMPSENVGRHLTRSSRPSTLIEEIFNQHRARVLIIIIGKSIFINHHHAAAGSYLLLMTCGVDSGEKGMVWKMLKLIRLGTDEQYLRKGKRRLDASSRQRAWRVGVERAAQHSSACDNQPEKPRARAARCRALAMFDLTTMFRAGARALAASASPARMRRRACLRYLTADINHRHFVAAIMSSSWCAALARKRPRQRRPISRHRNEMPPAPRRASPRGSDNRWQGDEPGGIIQTPGSQLAVTAGSTMTSTW